MNSPNGYIDTARVRLAGDQMTHGRVFSLPFGDNATPFKILMVSKLAPTTQPEQTWPNLPYFPAITVEEAHLPGGAMYLDVELAADDEPSPLFMGYQRYTGATPKWSDVFAVHIPDTEHNLDMFEKYDLYWIAGEGGSNIKQLT